MLLTTTTRAVSYYLIYRPLGRNMNDTSVQYISLGNNVLSPSFDMTDTTSPSLRSIAMQLQMQSWERQYWRALTGDSWVRDNPDPRIRTAEHTVSASQNCITQVGSYNFKSCSSKINGRFSNLSRCLTHLCHPVPRQCCHLGHCIACPLLHSLGPSASPLVLPVARQKPSN